MWIMHPQQEATIVANNGVSSNECCTVTGDISCGESNLTIKNTTKSHDGEWECKVSELGVKTARLTVIGSNEPHCSSSNGVGQNNEVIIGSIMVLNCSVESILPSSAKLVWMRDYKNITEHNSHQLSYTVQVKKEDHGVTFSCQLQHERIDEPFVCSDTITLDVQYKPIINVSSYSCVKKDTHQQLNCEYIPGNPPFTDVKWKTPPNNSVTKGNPFIIDDVDVLIGNPHNYTCIVTNTFFDGTHGEDVGVTNVQVQYKPIVSTPIKSSIMEGGDLRINCMVESVPPAYEIQWTTPSGDIYEGNTLTLFNVSRGQAGLYTCKATNKFCDDIGGHGHGTNSTYVDVESLLTSTDRFKNNSVTGDKETSFTKKTFPKHTHNIGTIKENAERKSVNVLVAAISCIIVIALLVVVILIILILWKHRRSTQKPKKLQCSYELDECIAMPARKQPLTRSSESRDDEAKHLDTPGLYVTPAKVRKQKQRASHRKLIHYKSVPTCESAVKELPFLLREKEQVPDPNSLADSDSSIEDCDDGPYELLNEPLPPRRYGPQYENTSPYSNRHFAELREEAAARPNSQILGYEPTRYDERGGGPTKHRHYENLKRNERIDRATETSGDIRTQVEPNVEDLRYAELDLSNTNQSPKRRTPRRVERTQYSSIDQLRTEQLRQDKKNTTKF